MTTPTTPTVLLLALTLTACGGPSVECVTTQTSDGAAYLECGDAEPVLLANPDVSGTPEAPIVTRVTPSGSCPGGGSLVEVGRDEDGDGALSDDEVDTSVQVCDGATGAPGEDGEDGTTRVEVTREPPGDACPRGGRRVRVGGDTDGDGVLDDDEVDPRHTALFCDPFTPRVEASGVTPSRRHTCARSRDSGVWCWGANDSGQLGDGASTSSSTPRRVVGLDSNVTSVRLADGWGCARTNVGGLKCWGRNTDGQLGDGSTASRGVAADVVGLTSGVAEVRLGGARACAITDAGGLRCWGDNFGGVLGDGSTTTRRTPVDVVGLTSGVASVVLGSAHTCALTDSGGVKCWGSNVAGQLGDPASFGSRVPVDVPGLTSGFTSVAVGSGHTCALDASGGVACWGSNLSGQLGDGSTTTRRAPVDVVGLAADVSSIALRDTSTCALMDAGGVKCWGKNDRGQLGDGSTTDRPEPTDVLGLTSVVSALALGRSHTCALTDAGGVRCWGGNAYGQLGDGSTVDRHAPVDVAGLTSGVAAIASGPDHACALTDAGAVACWGRNVDGRLGVGFVSDGVTTPAGLYAD